MLHEKYARTLVNSIETKQAIYETNTKRYSSDVVMGQRAVGMLEARKNRLTWPSPLDADQIRVI